MLAMSVKSINFADGTTGNYQKNLTNRRGDMLFEAVTLHRRFPYAVLAGILIFDEGSRQRRDRGAKLDVQERARSVPPLHSPRRPRWPR